MSIIPSRHAESIAFSLFRKVNRFVFIRRVSRAFQLRRESIAPSSLSAHSQPFLRLVKPIVLSSSDKLIFLPSLVMSFVFDLRSCFPILPLSIVPSSIFQFDLLFFFVSSALSFFAMSIIFSLDRASKASALVN